MKRFPTVNISQSLHHRLDMYALAASATGVSLLALSSPSQAKIVYTAVHQQITNHTVLDLNHDGINDLALEPGSATQSGLRLRYLYGAVSRRNRMVGQNSYASALEAGISIGPDQPLVVGRDLMAAWNSNGNRYQGQWINDGKGVKNRYLGIRFVIKGKIHYGWARLTVTPGKNFQATLTGYAYETIANKPIIAGRTKGPDKFEGGSDAGLRVPVRQSPGLGLLAMGSPALSIWRREEPVDPKSQAN